MTRSAPHPGPIDASPAGAWAGVLMLLLCAALWSLNGPLIKLAKNAGLHGQTIACYRSLIGGVVFLPLALRGLRTLRNVRPAWPVASVAMFTLMTLCFVLATTQGPAANAIVLQYTSPIWVFALSPLLLRERPGRGEGLVLLISMAGVAVIFLGDRTTSPLWLIVALASGFGYGALTVVLRALRPVSPLVVVAMNTIGSGLLLLPVVASAGQLLLDGRQWLILVVLGIAQFTLPYALFSWALQRVEAHRASLIVLIEAVLNPLWTYLAIGERPPAATLLGGPLVLAGVAAWMMLAWRRAALPTSAI